MPPYRASCRGVDRGSRTRIGGDLVTLRLVRLLGVGGRWAAFKGLASLKEPSPQPEPRQRLDKWLWFARVIKSRTLAAKLVEEGHVRVNTMRTDNPAKAVRPGDVLTIALDRQVRVLKILSGGERRGPYAEARVLYEDLTAGPAGAPAAD